MAVNFVKIIDEKLNKLEMYFRTRWLFVAKILKSSIHQPGHLTLTPDDGNISPLVLFYTTCCRSALRHVEPCLVYPDGLDGYEPCLFLSQHNDQYRKAWEHIDYIVCEHTEGEVTKIFYLRVQPLLNFIDKVFTDVEITPGSWFCRQDLLSGVPIMSLVDLGIVEIIDEVNWHLQTVTSLRNKSNIPLSRLFDNTSHSCKLVNTWKKAAVPFWHTFSLNVFVAPPKEITIRYLATNTTRVFPSRTAAAKELGIKPPSINNCLAGRQKTINTTFGKVMVEDPTSTYSRLSTN